jgi:hypothetical protein
VHKLDLGFTSVENVSTLGNVYDLDLTYCSGVKDVSSLGNVNTLCLRSCGGVTDVSSLSNILKLDTIGCNI